MKVAANSWKYINANLRVFIGRLGLTESISHPLTDKTITIMTNNDSQSAPSSKPARADLLKTITALCNELDELIMLLHEFYYQAAECIFGDEGNAGKPIQRGLSVFPQWLRQRDAEVLSVVHQLQEGLRAESA